MYLAPRHHPMARGEDRWKAIVAVIVVHLAIGLVLVRGLAVGMLPASSRLTRMIELSLPPVPPPPARHEARAAKSRATAAPALPAPKGGPKGPAKITTVAPDVTLAPITTAPAPGGGAGSGTAVGTGAGGGNGDGDGDGDGDGGSELEQISGEINPGDYPRALRDAGAGGRVSITFMVETSGRVGRCSVTRSSGIAELDQLTCRLIQQRFRFRPGTDRSGRPVAEEVDYDHDWISRRN